MPTDPTILKLIDRALKYPQKSAEWLSARHNILSSSEVAAALDSDLYKSSQELLKHKRLPLTDVGLTRSISTDWGEKYEPVAKCLFRQITNEEITDVGLILHDTIPWLGASPDALVLSKKLLEIKCPFTRPIICGVVPHNYWIQVQIQMEVCDIDECYFFQCQFEETSVHANDYQFSGVLENGTTWYLKKYTLEIIKRDREWFAKHIPLLTAFWQKVKYMRDDNVDPDVRIEESYTSDDWVCATATRNYLLNDPLIDWFDMYGTSTNETSAFHNYIKEQGINFEKAVVAYLYNKHPDDIITIANLHQARHPGKVEETISAMRRGVPIIYQAVLHNTTNKTYGIADLLIRSDHINKLFAKSVIDEETMTKGCAFNVNWHYVVVDIKHITLGLRADGVHLVNGGSTVAYKGQVYIYNLAVGQIQRYTPPTAYILGRKWTYASKNTIYAGNGWFDRLGSVAFETIDTDIAAKTLAAVEWARDVRANGRSWSIDPPSRIELYPNMSNDSDAPWHNIKKSIAKKNGEITSVYYNSFIHRNNAINKGIVDWRDKRCTASALGHNGPKLATLIDAILDINRSNDAIRYANKNFKLANSKVCFYIDFETINDVIENIHADHPITTSQSYIFMIGIGWTVRDNPTWNYRCLTVDSINTENEKEIFLSMHDTMLEVLESNDALDSCTVYHWSNAERTFYDKTASKYIDDLKQYTQYLHWTWYDLYKLFTDVPITVRGALKYSLKDIARAMHDHGFIQTIWDEDGILDGLDAMVRAAECSEDAKREGVSMTELPVMKQIIKYNEVDCKVMMEIVRYITNDIIEKSKVSKHSTITIRPKRKTIEAARDVFHEIPDKEIQSAIHDDINDLPVSVPRIKKLKSSNSNNPRKRMLRLNDSSDDDEIK